MKKHNVILTFLVLLIMTGCNRFPDIGNGYKLDNNSFGDVGLINSQNSYVVYGHILDYVYDSTYIIVTERPRDSVPGIKTMTLKEYDKVFEKSTFRQYWIIDKTQKCLFDEQTRTYSNVFGPFKKDEYIQKRKELKIPKGLEIKE